jgi:hypothetical protein
MNSIEVSYTCDRNSGQVHLTIKYNSDSGTLPREHERQHFDLVKRLLDEAGILGPDAGEICVHVCRAGVESIYYTSKVGEKLTWRLDSQRQIVEPTPLHPSDPQPLDPITNPVISE